MTGVFSEMVEMSLKEDSLNVRPYLNSENWGLRLATYVYIYSHAHPSVLLELIDSTEQAGQQPFVQHRGIEAIGKILEGSNREPEVVEGVERLRALPGRLGSHTLRHAELNRILQKFDDVSAGRNSNEVAGLD